MSSTVFVLLMEEKSRGENLQFWCSTLKIYSILIRTWYGQHKALKLTLVISFAKNEGRFFLTFCKQVAQLLQRDRATHALLRFAKLRSGIFEPPFWGA